MKIFIVGVGKLAKAIIESNLRFEASEICLWEKKPSDFYEKSVIVHAGSGRQLAECLAFCKQTNSTFVELSTGLETESLMPDFPLIVCPNTSILLLKTLNMLRNYGSTFTNYEISILESHQSTKTSEPGTAYSFVKSMGLAVEKIISIRNPEIQLKEIGIPEEFLEKHAYHKITIKDGSDEVIIETKVLGHQTYANGVKKIIEAVLKNTFENKKYTVLDLIDANIL